MDRGQMHRVLDERLSERGSVVVVRHDEEGVFGIENFQAQSGPDWLRTRHDALYGYLAAIDTELGATSGCGTFLLGVGMAVAACFAARERFPAHAGWWTDIPIVVTTLIALVQLDSTRERAVYARHAFELEERARRAQLAPAQLLAHIKGDPTLSRVSAHLARVVGGDPLSG